MCDLAQENSASEVLAVSHGAFLRALLLVLGEDAGCSFTEEVTMRLWVPNTAVFQFDVQSVSEVRCTVFNDAMHLEE